MARAAWYVYVQTWFDCSDFVAKCQTGDEARRIQTIVRDRIRRESGCACLVRVERITAAVARREALDYQIECNLALGRKGSPNVEAFAARVAAECGATNPTEQPKRGDVMDIEVGTEAKGAHGGSMAGRGSSTKPDTEHDDDEWLSPALLAKRYRIPLESTKKALARWRKRNAGGDGYLQNLDARPTDPQYVYRLRYVAPILQGIAGRHILREGRERTAPTGTKTSRKRPA